MSAPERVAPTIEGHIWLRIDFEEGGRYLGIPRRPVLAGPQHTYCPENRVRYTPCPTSSRWWLQGPATTCRQTGPSSSDSRSRPNKEGS